MTLVDAGVTELSTVRVKKAAEDNKEVPVEYLPSTIYVTDIPKEKKSEIKESLKVVFQECGKIVKLSLREDEETYTATIIFLKPTEAQDALQMDGTEICGAVVTVVCAAELNESAPSEEAASYMGSILATGYSIGEKGAANLKNLNGSLKVKTIF